MSDCLPQPYIGASYDEEIYYYLQDLATMPVLSLKAEKEMVQQLAIDVPAQRKSAARTTLIEANLRLVVRIARRYQPFGLELADLIQEGNLALIKATDQFDPQRSLLFKPFVTRRVCWALYRIVEKHLRERHIVESNLKPIRPLSIQVLKALAHNAIDEQALAFDLPRERFLALTALLDDINCSIHKDCSYVCQPLLANTLSPEEIYIASERGIWIAACMQSLTMKERLVLIHRYLLDTTQTLEKVGRILGVSAERVRQLEERGIKKMRNPRIAKMLLNLL